MNKLPLLFILVAGLSVLVSCKSKKAEGGEETVVARASVKITRPIRGSIRDQIVLNGKTVFLKKNQVVAPISGYISAVNVKYGDKVKEGNTLFEIQTRENKALKQSDQSDQNYGIVKVPATTNGVVNEPVTLGAGAYVTEGNLLCTLADNNDLLVKVNVPFENHELIKQGMPCTMYLPDNSKMDGFVLQVRPFVDEASQTQEVLIKPAGTFSLPENMNLTAEFQKSVSKDALLLPKKALLANETQDEFWVMKILGDSLAIKVPVETGIKNDSLVEIISSELKPGEIIIFEGGYGLEDSSLVNIAKEQ
jgi:multidrug efflux pump subunit AcrA (membrane-fusion protein)